MIHERELRIGSNVLCPGGEGVVYLISDKVGVASNGERKEYFPAEISPIKLTAERMASLGIDVYNADTSGRFLTANNQLVGLSMPSDGQPAKFWIGSNHIRIHSVHCLQNLLHVLSEGNGY
jgi:hypothetical protein